MDRLKKLIFWVNKNTTFEQIETFIPGLGCWHRCASRLAIDMEIWRTHEIRLMDYSMRPFGLPRVPDQFPPARAAEFVDDAIDKNQDALVPRANRGQRWIP